MDKNTRVIGSKACGKPTCVLSVNALCYRDGEGILLEPNSQKYEGFWKDNQREGFGKQTYVGSSILCYEGNWKQDKRSGSGCAHYVDGSVVKAEWVSDDIVASEKPVTIVFPNGDKYAG